MTTPDVAEAEAGVSSLTQDVEMSIELSSTAFNRIRRIPIEHACPSNKTNPNLGDIRDGGNLSPPLAWTGAPEGTVSLAMVMEGIEPRADEPNVHWLVWNIPAEVTELPAGTPTTTLLASIGPGPHRAQTALGGSATTGPAPSRSTSRDRIGQEEGTRSAVTTSGSTRWTSSSIWPPAPLSRSYCGPSTDTFWLAARSWESGSASTSDGS